MVNHPMRAHELLHQFLVTDDDLELIADFGQNTEVLVSDLIKDFYTWLANQSWYEEFFSAGVPGRVKNLQQAYWRDFLTGHVNDAYIDRRVRVGEIHAAINLPVSAYLAGMNFAQNWFFLKARRIYRSKRRCLDVQSAISRLIQMDSNIVMQVYAAQSMNIIREQGELTEAIVSEATRVASIAAQGNFHVHYERQDPEDGLEQPINQLINALHQVTAQAHEIAEGNYEIQITLANEDDELGKAMQQMVRSLQEVGTMAGAIAKGNYDIELTPRGSKDTLTKSLNQMVESLRSFRLFSEREKWIKTGVAELAIALRESDSIQALTEQTIQFISNYLNADIGLFYVLDESQRAVLSASYAYSQAPGSTLIFAPGEGLVGQVIKEKTPKVINTVPENYLTVRSGMGSGSVTNVLLFPIIVNNELRGILELGSFSPFTPEHQEWLNQVSESIGVAIKSTEDQAMMQELLKTTQQKSLELRDQQRELQSANDQLEQQALALRNSEEALKEQKTQLEQSNSELTRKTAVLERQKADLEQAKLALQAKADQLSTTSQYKSEFLANMSHELRTPLNSLLLLSQSLLNNTEKNLSESQLDDLNIIHRGGGSLLALINDILDLSKVEAGKLNLAFSAIEMHRLISELESEFRLLADEKNLKFHTEVQLPKDFHLYSDEQRIRQILTNLLSNAVKFTDEGQITLRVLHIESTMQFEVEDTGIGIPQDKQTGVFEAFSQVDGTISRLYGGTGLGLTISRDLASLLGGEINLLSSAGKGSVFTLTLPLTVQDKKPYQRTHEEYDDRQHNSTLVIAPGAENFLSNPIDSVPALDPGDASTPSKSGHRKHNTVQPDNGDQADTHTQDDYERGDGQRILIVDDDLRNTYTLSKILSQIGYEVTIADNGELAIEKLIQDSSIQLILMDIMMPVLDGYATTERIRSEISGKIPIIALTAKALPEDRQHCLNAGANDYMPKPVDLYQLTEKVSHWITQANANGKATVQ